MPKYDRERLPDAHGLVDIESSFSKLVGNKLAAALDPKFLKLVVHVVFGEFHCCFRHLCFGHMDLSWSHGTVVVTWHSPDDMSHSGHTAHLGHMLGRGCKQA